MFLARVIAVLTVLVTLVAGANLRADENELQTLSPDHGELINAAVRRHVHGFKSMAATDKSMIDAHVNVASLAHIKEIKKLESTGSHYVGTSSMNDLVEDGYVMTRHRANADCSGIVRSLSGYRIGNGNGCYSYDSTSFKSACFRNKKQDELQLQTLYYNNADCSGDPSSIYDGDDLPKCAINYENFNSTGFEMIGSQCTGETDISKDLKPGIVSAAYFDSSCSGSIISFYNMRLGACFPIVAHADGEGEAIGPNTKYFYGTWDECYSNGKATMSLYTDSVCTRIFAKTTTRIFDEPLDQCTSEGSGVYSKIWCIPKN
jgi:hypothetical protein